MGLPLAVEFGHNYPTVGFDVKLERIAEFEDGRDATLEVSREELAMIFDPYYFIYKAWQPGYHPQMILAGRHINDNMSLYFASQIIKRMATMNSRR